MRSYFSEGGLRKWVSEKWVDIGAPKKNGKYQQKFYPVQVPVCLPKPRVKIWDLNKL